MKFGKSQILIGLAIIVGVIISLLIGIAALKFYIIVLLLSVPFFLFLRYFGFSFDESIIFSLFLGIGFFPLLLYGFGIIGLGLKVSTIVLWILLTVISSILYYIKFFKKNKDENKNLD